MKRGSGGCPVQTSYYPPADGEVERYARQLCRDWAKELAPEYNQMEFVSGFVRFVKLAVKIKTKYLNRRSEKEHHE